MTLLAALRRRSPFLLALLVACSAQRDQTAPPLVQVQDLAPASNKDGASGDAANRDAANGDLVQRTMSRLDLEQKAGQLFVSWIRADADATERARIEGFVREVGLGGVILSLGSVDEAAAVVTQMQAASALPLLVAGDFEGGVAFRLQGATQMGNQMLVAASGLTRLATAMGRVTGHEAAALGAPWVLAPVLDVNSNPANPIINVRSFGEEPQFVAAMGRAFVDGVQEGGEALACGKHFPGHGDVDTDSHLALPTVRGSGELLRARELVPFREAAAAGLGSVMTGHLSVEGLGEEASVPATLSRKILVDVLRNELGFRGLVVTDALDMGGVKNKIAPAEVAVRALAAGADVLLMPPEPILARDAVVQAVRDGRVPQARLDDAVRRILLEKARLGLLSGGEHGPHSTWKQEVATAASFAVADEIAARGITLVRDDKGLVPVDRSAPWLCVTVRDKELLGGGAPEGDREGPAAFRACSIPIGEELEIAGDSDAEMVANVAAKIRRNERVVLLLHVRVRSHSGRIGLPATLAPVLAALPQVDQVVAVSFGSPYLVTDLPPDAAFVCAYASTVRTAHAAARVLAGSAPVHGRLPVSIPSVARRGHGLTLLPGNELATGDPVTEGLPLDLSARIRSVLQDAVATKVTPSAVCVVVRRGAVVAEVAVGHYTYDASSPSVGLDTRYDLASLTKVCATTPAVLCLVDDGALSLDDPVQKWLPEFQGVGKDKVTVRHLLAHTAGLPAYERYYRTLSGKDAIVAAALREGLMNEPGKRVVYSDLGLVLTMAIVERCSGKPFDQFVKAHVFDPLGMSTACFAPRDREKIDAAPTEVNDERSGLVQGYVHDENAFAMGGVSGHAGMFGTARDVAKLSVAMLSRGRGFVSARSVDAALKVQSDVGSNRLVGFDVLEASGIGGALVSSGSFGHTGFTGTSLLCDPQRDVAVVLLTNRVHPTRVNDSIKQLRQRLHTCVLSAIDEGNKTRPTGTVR
ncbi:MAG: glycoside hydrolase family 3 N-terminal domain-containing protein [Planctomycetota bacterium]